MLNPKPCLLAPAGSTCHIQAFHTVYWTGQSGAQQICLVTLSCHEVLLMGQQHLSNGYCEKTLQGHAPKILWPFKNVPHFSKRGFFPPTVTTNFHSFLYERKTSQRILLSLPRCTVLWTFLINCKWTHLNLLLECYMFCFCDKRALGFKSKPSIHIF